MAIVVTGPRYVGGIWEGARRSQGTFYLCSVGKGIIIQKVHPIYLQQKVMALRLFVYYNL